MIHKSSLEIKRTVGSADLGEGESQPIRSRQTFGKQKFNGQFDLAKYVVRGGVVA